MADYLATMSAQIGIDLWLFVIILIWSLVWKLLALWKSARNGSVIWFIVLAVLNTVGILEILYIFVFSKIKRKKTKSKRIKTKSKRAVKKKRTRKRKRAKKRK